MSNTTSPLERAAIASGYAAFTSSGYVVAILTAWVVLWRIERSRYRLKGGSRKVGSYGKMMAILDAVDAIPEAMVVAGATADGRMSVAFALSVFLLNSVNTMATAFDFLAVRPERSLHRLLVVLVFFSVGSLFLSVSEAVFENFLETARAQSANYLLLVPIMGGVACGVGAVWATLYLQTQWKKRQARAGNSDFDPPIHDSITMVRQAIGQKTDLLDQVRSSPVSPQERRPSEEHYESQVRNLEVLLEALTKMDDVSTSMDLSATDDARDVVAESIMDEVTRMHAVNGHLLGESVVAAEDGEPVGETLNRRAVRLGMIYLLIGVWTVGLTFVLTPLFAYLATGYADAFADGFSAGAFFSVISSTMIPRIQQDAYRSHWSSLTFRVVGMVAFVCGICTTFFLELVPAPGQ